MRSTMRKQLPVVLVVAASAWATVLSQSGATGVVAYEGARLIIGDSRRPIDRGTFVVRDGRIIDVGRAGAW